MNNLNGAFECTSSAQSYFPLSGTTSVAKYIPDVCVKPFFPKMRVFNWVLINAYEEGSEPIKSGTISAKTEESAREYIVHFFEEEQFHLYKIGDVVLITTEIGSW